MMDDEVARYNQARWAAMAQARALFTRPFLDLTAEDARDWLDPDGRLPHVSGKRVLCLASGGGRQSACFGLLGAEVTVLDLIEYLSEETEPIAGTTPGDWHHLVATIPPWLRLWTRLGICQRDVSQPWSAY
jgi:hypothetical protein